MCSSDLRDSGHVTTVCLCLQTLFKSQRSTAEVARGKPVSVVRSRVGESLLRPRSWTAENTSKRKKSSMRVELITPKPPPPPEIQLLKLNAKGIGIKKKERSVNLYCTPSTTLFSWGKRAGQLTKETLCSLERETMLKKQA